MTTPIRPKQPFKVPTKQPVPEAPDVKQDLRKCFCTVVDRKDLTLTIEQLKDILQKDLTINIIKLKPELLAVLTESLLYYMQVWPGWQRSIEYFKGQLTFKEWFNRFRQYLIYKINFLIKNQDKYCLEMEANTTSSLVSLPVHAETQTTQPAYVGSNKPDSPYALYIGGPPSVLNNVVFMELENNILIKQHVEKPWKAIKLDQFLNWPYVSIDVKLPDISFSRRNVHEFQRYIGLCGDTTICHGRERIAYVKKIDEGDLFQPYTYKFLAEYHRQFIEMLSKIPEVVPNRVEELDTIFKEFLADIKEANISGMTMSSNASVCYRIGNNKYIRNKKMVTGINQKAPDKNSINFYEVIVPKVEFSLHYVKAKQSTTRSEIFESLDILEDPTKIESFTNLINIGITYTCLLCSVIFCGRNAIMDALDHYKEVHKAEHAVLCFKCKMQFSVNTITSQRWSHNCQ